MKKIIIYILAFLPLCSNAQTLSIQELWDKLSETNIARQNQLEVQIANQELAIERLNRFPIVYGDANLQRNLIIPTTPVPAIAFDPSAQQGAITPLKFATKWNTKAGLQAEWKFFDPNRKTTLKEKNILVEKSQIEQKRSAQNIKKDATLAYASIVLASLQHQAAVEDSVLYEQILRTTTIRYEAGRETTEQLLNAQQEYERKKIQLYETWSVLCEADLELQKYIETSTIKQLTTNIEGIKEALKAYENINYDAQINTLDITLSENERQSIKRQLLPSLTFNAYYGAQYFNNELRLFNSDNWFGNSYANVALRLPISSYLIQNPTLNKINSQRTLHQIKLEESNKLDEIQRNQQQQKIIAAEQKVKSYQRIVDLSKENLEKQRLEYSSGRILLSDYNRSLNNHSNNQKELWQAQYNLIDIFIN